MQKDNNGQIIILHYYKRIFLHVCLPLFCGTIIYSFWRDMHFIDPTQKIFPLLTTKPPDWIKYNLPDGLWFYALLSSIFFIWKEKISGHSFMWLLITIILSFFSEVLQAYNVINGTFDWNDLLAYSIAIFFFFFNFKQINKQLLFTFKITKQ